MFNGLGKIVENKRSFNCVKVNPCDTSQYYTYPKTGLSCTPVSGISSCYNCTCNGYTYSDASAAASKAAQIGSTVVAIYHGYCVPYGGSSNNCTPKSTCDATCESWGAGASACIGCRQNQCH